MSISMVEPIVKAVTITDDELAVELQDGRKLSVPLVWFPRLLHATPEARSKARIGIGGRGIHWDDLDEDISVKGLLLGYGDRTRGAEQGVRKGA